VVSVMDPYGRILGFLDRKFNNSFFKWLGNDKNPVYKLYHKFTPRTVSRKWITKLCTNYEFTVLAGLIVSLRFGKYNT
jgi:hypothetical protein